MNSVGERLRDDLSRAYWDNRPAPGRADDDPMCINFCCPSAFSCRRFSQEPYQGRSSTIFIDPVPDLLGGLLCDQFDPDVPNPAPARAEQEAGE